jgi:D-beta-D-heptose 7-phosphate kinase/D-beta-D-heptose 1-phosphate adenosyltransferase
LILKAFSYDFFRELRILRRQPIVFFNGCFDIIHGGHIKLINRAKTLASNNNAKLVCGLNSDNSVSKLNKSHPLIHKEDDRARLLEDLGVDVILINDDETPTSLLMSLTPDYVIKGSDYQEKQYHEREFLEIINTKIIYIELADGLSTTNIYNKIEEQVKAKIKESL